MSVNQGSIDIGGTVDDRVARSSPAGGGAEIYDVPLAIEF
jgi:hypothetical protein